MTTGMKPRRKRKLDPSVIREGDRVRIVTPVVVLRVGYPKCLADYKDEASRVFMPGIREKATEIGLKFDGQGLAYIVTAPLMPHCHDRIVSELAYMLARKDGFGGDERTLHVEEHPELKDREYTVADVKTVYTGRRVAPSYSYDPYNGDGDFDPGGLADSECHRLVRIQTGIAQALDVSKVQAGNGHVWIQRKHVEKGGV